MITKEFIDQSYKETQELTKKIDKVISDYLATSEMPKNQKIVNIGRALNAYHVGWIANLSAVLEQRHEHFVSRGERDPAPAGQVYKEL